jgi:molecular chaperone DnaJ
MDFYILLGIERGATLNDIKRAYKRLARRFHPDINPGDRTAAAQFRQIAEAYETLSDPDRRLRYDAGGMDRSRVEQTFGFEGFDFSVSVSGASAPTFGDLFADVLRHRQGTRNDGTPERGADLHQSLSLPFEEAMRGGHRQVAITRHDLCRSCQGAGRQQGAEGRCLHCHGTGAVKSARGHMIFSKPCAHCGGSGQQGQARCLACGGAQIEMRAETLNIPVPAGFSDGARVRVPGKGHAGRNGGEPGDLYVTVHVEPHPLFRREGDDLHLVVPVAVHEAALGAKVEVPSLEGFARLRVPPGTQSGQRFRLRERGVPSARGGRRGDLVVEVRLVLPRVLDERSKELMREFGRLNTESVRDELGR